MILELVVAGGIVAVRSLWKRWKERSCKWEHNGCLAEINSPEHPDWKDDACLRCKKTQREYCPLAPASMYTDNYGDLYRRKGPFSSQDWALLGERDGTVCSQEPWEVLGI